MLLDSIIEFCSNLREIVENTNPATDILICSGGSNAEAASFVLVGCYLILHEGQRLETVKALFHNRMPGPALAVAQSTGHSSIGSAGSADSSDVWDALDHAVRLGWLSPTAPDAEPALDLEEQAHYARPANGGVHIVVPGKLLFLREPDCRLPPGRDWADAEAADGTAARRFSPAFCASLLSALGVSVAAGLEGRLSPAAAAALADAGVDATELGLERDGGGMLRALDRLITLSRAAPGAVAVVCGEGGTAGAAETLVTAFLVGRHGFTAAAAAAWVRLAAPWLLSEGGDASRPDA